MNNSTDVSAFDPDDFTQPPRYPDGPDSAVIRDFVLEAINEGAVLPVAIDPNGRLLLMMDSFFASRRPSFHWRY